MEITWFHHTQASQQHVQQPIQSQGSVGNGQPVIQGAQGVYPQAYGAFPQVMPQQALPQVMPQQAFQNFMPFQNMPPAVGGWGTLPRAPAPPMSPAPDASGGAQQAHFMVNGTGYAPATGMGQIPSDGHVQVNGSWFAPVQNAKP